MQTIDRDKERERKSTFSPTTIITPEEYSALMSGLASLESELELLPRLREAEKQVRRLEFILMMLVGLLMVVFVLCRAG